MKKLNEKLSTEQGKIADDTLLAVVDLKHLLSNWDKAVVDLIRPQNIFVFKNVRLRNCSLHYNETCREYYVEHRGVTFNLWSIYNYR